MHMPMLVDYAFPDRYVGYVARNWVVGEDFYDTLPHKIWFNADAIYRLTQQGEGADDDRPGWNPGHPIGNLKWCINFHDDKPEEEFVNATLKGVTYAWELTNDEKCCAAHQLGVWRD